jgi:hypothetical protein
LAIFMSFILTSMGIGLILMASNEATQGKASLRPKVAFFLAEAGEEDGRASLRAINGTNDFNFSMPNYVGADGEFSVDADALKIVYDANGVPTAVTGYGDDVPLRGLTPFADGWYATFLSNDPVDGIENVVDTNDLVMLTSIGVTNQRAVEVVQAIVERWDVLFSMPPATITLLGPTPQFDGGNSDSHTYSGDDCGGSGIPGLYVPVVGTIGPVAEATAEMGIHYDEVEDEGPDYEAGPYLREDAFADLTDPTEPTLTAGAYDAFDARWQDCFALKQMVEDFRNLADHYCTGDDCEMPDPLDISDLTFIDGDFVVGPDGGVGTLCVTGELRYNGRAPWNGMIFVIGEGYFDQEGAGNGTISGSILVADIAGPDNIYGTIDDCTGPDNGFDSVFFDLAGGGNGDTLFCTADQIASKPNPPYRITSFRQF